MNASPSGPPSGRSPRTEADLRAAVEEAARALEAARTAARTARPSERDEEPGRRPLRLAAGILAVGVLALALFLRVGAGAPPADAVETDLRWAVARVVEHIERERVLRGRLPDHDDLRLLLGERLTYVVGRDGLYRVVGARGEVRVEYDGSVPLETWAQGRGGAPTGGS